MIKVEKFLKQDTLIILGNILLYFLIFTPLKLSDEHFNIYYYIKWYITH